MCAIWQAHGQFLRQAHRGRVLLYLTSVISHNTERILIMWQRFAFGVNTPCYLLQSSIKRRPVKLPTPVSLFSLLSFFFAENCASLHILGRWKCCSTTLCLLTNLGSSSRSSPDTQTLWWDSTPGSKSESALIFLCFFFFGDWRKSMRAHNEKHRKKLAWPKQKDALRYLPTLYLPDWDKHGLIARTMVVCVCVSLCARTLQRCGLFGLQLALAIFKRLSCKTSSNLFLYVAF